MFMVGSHISTWVRVGCALCAVFGRGPGPSAVFQPRALLHTLAELNEHGKKGNFPKILEGDGVCAAQ